MFILIDNNEEYGVINTEWTSIKLVEAGVITRGIHKWSNTFV